MKSFTLIMLLFFSIICRAQENDSLARMREKVDSFMSRIDQIARTFPESPLVGETKEKINKANRSIDSLNIKINNDCKGNHNSKMCQTKTIVNECFDTINYNIDNYNSLINALDEHSTYYWTKTDSICIYDLKLSMVNATSNLCSEVIMFDDSTKLIITNFLKTNGDGYDLRKRFSNGVFSVGIIKLHLLTLRRNIKKLQVRLLEYLIKNSS